MPKNNVPEEFESERMIIRMPRISDSAEIYEAINESRNELVPWLPWAKNSSLENTRESTRLAVAKFKSREDLRYHFHDKNTGRFLAGSGLHRIDWHVPKFEIGFWCRSSQVGKGYVTEGVKALTAMAFERLKAARVEIRCDQRNLASAAVAKRAGFRLEGILVNDRRDHNNILSSTMLFAKTA